MLTPNPNGFGVGSASAILETPIPPTIRATELTAVGNAPLLPLAAADAADWAA